jgi:hypothetical protein
MGFDGNEPVFCGDSETDSLVLFYFMLRIQVVQRNQDLLVW